MSAYQAVQSAVELFDLIAKDIDEILEKTSWSSEETTIPPYGKLYDLPLGKVVGFVFQTFGLLEGFSKAAASENPHVGILEYAKAAEPQIDIEPDKIGSLILSLLVLSKDLVSISLFHESIHQLLSKGATGDDEALFKAIYIDPNVLQSSVVAQRIATASVNDDGEFFDSLSKSIKKSRPIRPREHLDAVRVMLAIVDECKGLDSVTDSELTSWATEFNLYPVDSDALMAIRRQRQKHEKIARHQ